jgi:hypothetical protein
MVLTLVGGPHNAGLPSMIAANDGSKLENWVLICFDNLN